MQKSDDPGGAPNHKVKPKLLPNNKQNNEITLYVYNVVEDEWSFISALSNPIEQAREIESSRSSVDTFFLGYANGSHLLFISPIEISREFQDYARSITNYKSTEVITPKARTHLLCQDLIHDSETFNRIVEQVRDCKKVTLLSYAATPEFYELKNAFIKAGVNVYTPEAPEIESAWTVNFYGSKSGIRQLAQKSVAIEPDFMRPEGVIVVGT